MGMAVFGSLIYFCESGTWTVNEEYPQGAYLRTSSDGMSLELTPFTSIPASFWWVIVTFTTVGYGDVFPTTVAGRFVGAVTMFAGIITLALPISIVGGSFAEQYGLLAEIRSKDEAMAAKKRSNEVKAYIANRCFGEHARDIELEDIQANKDSNDDKDKERDVNKGGGKGVGVLAPHDEENKTGDEEGHQLLDGAGASVAALCAANADADASADAATSSGIVLVESPMAVDKKLVMSVFRDLEGLLGQLPLKERKEVVCLATSKLVQTL